VLTRLGIHISGKTLLAPTRETGASRLCGVARAAEDHGFDAVFLPDPVVVPATPAALVGAAAALLEPYVLLGALAVETTRVRLGVMVSDASSRNPAHLAKQASTLDVLSNGRALLGLGAGRAARPGWKVVGALSAAERLSRLEEALTICRVMLEEEDPSFTGRYYRISHAANRPRSGRDDGGTTIPVLVGGSSPAIMRLAAEHADYWNVAASPAELGELASWARRAREAAGGDPVTFGVTAFRVPVLGDRRSTAEARAKRLAKEWGVGTGEMDRLFSIGDLDSVLDQLSAILEAGIDGLVLSTAAFAPTEAAAIVGSIGEGLGSDSGMVGRDS